MSILNRFSDIVNSNVNSMLDQAEDPKKMVSFIVREMEQTLRTMRTETTGLQATHTQLVHKRDQLVKEYDQWQQRAALAIEKTRDDLARAAIKEKNLVQQAIDQCLVEITHIDDVVAKIASDSKQLEEKLKLTKTRYKALILRGNSVKSRMKVKRQLHDFSCNDALTRFDAYERKIDELEGEVASFGLGAASDNASNNSDLEVQIAALALDDRLDNELSALKQKIQQGDSPLPR